MTSGTSKTMSSCFQAVALVAAPSHPNAIAWSDENLIAVASGRLVTILNPTSPFGARGVITIPTSDPFSIGVIEKKDLSSGCLLPIRLLRDRQHCVRSIAWSPLGMAPNAGCLLVVCSTEGRVKLYRPPFYDFSAEWVEVMDISNKLYDYFSSIKFGELDVPCSTCARKPVEEVESANVFQKCSTKEGSKRRKKELPNLKSCSSKGSEVHKDQPQYPRDSETCNSNSRPPDFVGLALPMFNESSVNQLVEKTKEKHPRKIEESLVSPLISAYQYASCSAMLSSLVVAWSPVMQPSLKAHPHPNSAASILAVGGKSGNVSFWKVNVPECYSVGECLSPTKAELVGFLQAHNSWTNCISWVLLDSNMSNPKVLLATGSTDGSVRIWLCSREELMGSSESNFASFSLLKEVIGAEAVPITLLSFSVPNMSVGKLFLAVGKGSGSFEIRIFNISRSKFDIVGLYDAHDHVVTGLAWAFDGHYLYSCSEDNTLRGWNLDGSSIHEVPISSSMPHLRSSIDLPDAFRSCFGLAVSPGNLVAAVVRNFDVELLDPMYQARSQKAAVEFFWIGGLETEDVSNNSSDIQTENSPYFSKKELVHWESSILWSLNQFENLDKPLVVWDIGAALLAFQQSMPEYVEHIILKWLKTSYVGCNKELSPDEILLRVLKNVSKFSTRRLHLLNIICRRVVLSEVMQDQGNNKPQNLEGLDDSEDEKNILWKKLLLSSERELRQRLIGLSFVALAKLPSLSDIVGRPGYWYPVGLVEMQQWVRYNHEHLRESLKVIASEAGIRHKSEPSAKEQCTFCSESVPFESPEVGFCQGINSYSNEGSAQRHKLERCSVSMQVCPAFSPLWFCVCCYRSAFRLPPETLFQMSETPNFSSMKLSDTVIPSKPLCPFCGILLLRRQPDFLLSASPV